ncbi:hypothetical protein Hypma_011299 [Hypsizygus marmoreus]|uniref:Uncharacterized protein n=1 Tax=Hypsizygus marmoreus TaxID=39966 RepID=A0A369JIK5_HYPMA|nr:hypothetical protein Hypma_011299 [Hypsizygus marmoreus]
MCPKSSARFSSADSSRFYSYLIPVSSPSHRRKTALPVFSIARWYPLSLIFSSGVIITTAGVIEPPSRLLKNGEKSHPRDIVGCLRCRYLSIDQLTDDHHCELGSLMRYVERPIAIQHGQSLYHNPRLVIPLTGQGCSYAQFRVFDRESWTRRQKSPHLAAWTSNTITVCKRERQRTSMTRYHAMVIDAAVLRRIVTTVSGTHPFPHPLAGSRQIAL